MSLTLSLSLAFSSFVGGRHSVFYMSFVCQSYPSVQCGWHPSVLFPRDSVSYAVGYSMKLATVTGFFFLCVWTSFSLLHAFCGSFYFNVIKRCDGSARKSKRPHQLPLIHASEKTTTWKTAGCGSFIVAYFQPASFIIQLTFYSLNNNQTSYFSINCGAAGVILEKREMYKTIRLLSWTVFW